MFGTTSALPLPFPGLPKLGPLPFAPATDLLSSMQELSKSELNSTTPTPIGLLQALFLAQWQEQQKALLRSQLLSGLLGTHPPTHQAKSLSPPVSPPTHSRKRPSSSSSSKKAASVTSENAENPRPQKRAKQQRRLFNEDHETNSPVSGMYIRDRSELTPEELAKAHELDESASCVRPSEETRDAIQQIPNTIGNSVCRLCLTEYDDVFRLAQHKCPCIVYADYQCPECDKSFTCPANLASHRRWHVPRKERKNAISPSPSAPSPSQESLASGSSPVPPNDNPLMQFLTETIMSMQASSSVPESLKASDTCSSDEN